MNAVKKDKYLLFRQGVGDIWIIHRPLIYLYLLVLIGCFALLGNDQAFDLYVSFLDTYEIYKSSFIKALTANNYYFIKFTIALTFWALTLWYASRLTLQFCNLSTVRRTWFNKFQIIWIPRVLGIIPFLIPIYGFWDVNSTHFVLSLIHIVLAAGSFAFFISREKAWKIKKIRFAFEKITWDQFPSETKMVIYIVWALGAVLLILFSLPASLRVAAWFRPGTIIVSSLFSLTIIITLINYKDSKTRIPLFFLIPFIVFIFSYFNNNHQIRMIPSSERAVHERLEFPVYFKDWIEHRSKDLNEADSIPVYIIAAEGGGIRALNWTALVLENLRRKDPAFYDHIVAISGVSGGSIGALFHTLYAQDFGRQQNDSLYLQFKKSISQDFLSPITAALLYPDLLQRFLPLKIGYFDRARWLEDSWSVAYKNNLGKKSFDQPFLSLWNNRENMPPCLFLNGTLSETGQKTIISNIKLSEKYFYDVIDIYEIIQEDVPAKTAGLLSARFPIITPGAVIKTASRKPYGNVVDGGYVENTALGTAVQVLNQVLDLIDTANHELEINNAIKRRIKPVIVFIKNGDTNYAPPKFQYFSYETLIPINAFIKSWGRSGESTAFSVKQITDRVRPKLGFEKFELDRRVKNPQGHYINLPLGWFLSETAANEIARQAEGLGVGSWKTEDRSRK